MDHFAGLDVSVKETSVCIVDDTGKLRTRNETSVSLRVDAPCARAVYRVEPTSGLRHRQTFTTACRGGRSARFGPLANTLTLVVASSQP